MLGEENNLTDVVGIVGHLPIDGLQYGVRLTSNRHRAHEVFRLERLRRRENLCPALFPPAHDLVSRSSRVHFEFLIAVAIGFFAVGRKKVGKA